MAAKRKGASAWLRRFATSLVLGANLVSLLLLWGCCLSTQISPSLHPRITVVGLVFPVLLICNVIFLPLWLLFKPRYALVPLLGLLLCGGFILDYFPVSRPSDQPDSLGQLTLLSWNVGGAYYSDDNEAAVAYLEQAGADIICLQECAGPLGELVAQRMGELGYQSKILNGRNLYCRFPIVSADTMVAPTNFCNGVCRFSVLMNEDTVWVLNCHLESTGFTQSERDEYTQTIQDPTKDDLKREGQFIIGKLAQRAHFRGKQTDSLAAFIDRHAADRLLVIGDFNDTPISYAYQQLDKRLTSAYRQAGRGLGISFNQHGFPVRIDHIFCSSHWEPAEAHIVDTIYESDHFPMEVKLRKVAK
ncbi:MAG: endonuclease/exonuclease/phosphatase family protein [Bacteroidaceae bacterium]|nr:endonuclease/exonuclease/phosphatase family protein [Bacteroidaceae bacterium]